MVAMIFIATSAGTALPRYKDTATSQVMGTIHEKADSLAARNSSSSLICIGSSYLSSSFLNLGYSHLDRQGQLAHRDSCAGTQQLSVGCF